MSPEDELEALVKHGEEQAEKARSEQGNIARNSYERAVVTYDKAARLAEKYLGKYDDNTLAIRDCLAAALRGSGSISRAILINKENVSRYQNCQGDPHHLTLEAKRQLAECYLAYHEYSEAIKTYRNIISSRSQVSNIDLYQDRTDLAAALFESGTTANVMEAVDLNIRTLELVSKKLGEDHIETIKVRHNLATELSKLKKNEDAMQYFEKNLSLLQHRNCRARVDDAYRKYVKLSKDSLEVCSKIFQREKMKKAEQRKLEKEQIANEKREKERLKKEQQEKLEKERLRRLEEEQAETLRKEKAEEERTREEAARKQRRLQRKQRTEQERLEQERIEVAKLEAARLENERLEKEKLEAERTQLKEKKQKKEGQLVKEHQESKRSHSRDPSIANQKEKVRVSQNQKPSTSQKEHHQKSETKTEVKTQPEALDDKSTAASKKKEQRRNRVDAYPDPDTLQMQNVGKKLERRKTPEATKSKSFEVLPVLKLDTQEGNRKSLHTRSNSTSERPSSALELPSIVLESKGESSLSSAKSEKRSECNRADSRSRTTRRLSPETHEPVKDIEPRPKKTELLVEAQDGSKKTSTGNRSRKSSPKPREGHKKVQDPHSALTQSSGSKSTLHSEERRSLASTVPVNDVPVNDVPVNDVPKHRKHSIGRIDTDLAAVLQSNETKSNSSDILVLPSVLEPPAEHTARPAIQQNSDDLLDMAHAELDIHPKGGTAKSPSSSDSALLSPGWMQSLRAISNYTAKAAGTFTNRRGSLPQQLEHGNSLEYSVEAGPSRSESILEGQDIKNQSEPELIAPSYPIYTDQYRTSSVPGSWDQDFDEPRLEPDNAMNSSKNDFQDNAVMQDASPNFPDRNIAPPEEAKNVRRRSSDLRQPSQFSPTEIQNADDWFLDLEEHVHSMLDRYKDDPSTSKPKRRVKIAILDTGVARDLKKGPASMRSPRIKLGKQLDTSLHWGEDVDGHGTHAAGLIHKVCPNADIFVYRVLESHESLTDEKPLSREYVAEALADAVDKKNVDIVSMSLGWKEDSNEKLRDVIDHAKRNKVLLFAASSNDGVRGGIAYPARADEVIAIDAADGYGRPSRFNPLHDDKKTRFAVLGEAVKSEYPKDLDKSGSKRMSGTSCATPIAAGIAGLILEFARQRPMWCDPSIEAHLKTVGGMRQVFMKMSKRVDGFRCLDPTLLFKCRKNFEDGGEWSEDQSPRKIAAYKIQEALQEIFSSDLGEEMNTAIKIEQAKRVIEQARRDAMGGN